MHRYLIPGLQLSPGIFERLIAELPDDRLNTPTHPDRFSPREVIAHLADWEPIMREERIRFAAEQPGGSFNAYDEVEMAATNRYAESDIQEQLKRFAEERAKTVAYVANIPTETWNNSARHPEAGELKLWQIVNMILGHDTYHVAQLTEVLPERK